MPPPSAVRLTIVAGDVELAVWCWACMLPSAVRIPLYVVDPSGVGRLGYVEECTNENHEGIG